MARLQAPLYFSVQTRPAVADGVLGFAFFTPYRTTHTLLGTGTIAGNYQQEAGQQLVRGQYGDNLSYGGLFAGITAQQPLSDTDYLASLT